MEKLYYSDPLLTFADATVLDIIPNKNRPILILDRTIFYPEGGGQPCDMGSIQNVALVDVQLDNGLIRHTLAAPLDVAPGTTVGLVLDAVRRQDNTEQHSGQHLLSAVLEHDYGIHTVSFHLGEHYSTIDVGTQALLPPVLDAIEAKVDAHIIAARPFITHVCPPEDAFSFPLRKKPTAEILRRGEELRIVEIENVDWSPCGGTHVKNTLQLRAFKIARAEKYKGMLRIYFVTGVRALDELKTGCCAADQAARMLGCARAEVPCTLEAVRNRADIAETELRDLVLQRAKLEVRLAFAGTEAHKKCLRFEYEDRDARTAFETAKAAAAAGACAIVVSLPERTVCAQVPAIRPEWGTGGLGARLKEISIQAGGRGGGGATNFRAAFASVEAARRFADMAETVV